MEKYKNSIIKLLKNPIFIVPVIIVAIGSFGFLLTHETINIDTLSGDRYFSDGELIAQQRLIGPLIEKVFGIMNFYPFLADFLAMLVFIIASMLYCSLFDRVSKGNIKVIAYTVFACIFISYPLAMEYFVYVPMGLDIAIGFCFVAISLMAFYEFINSLSTKKSALLISAITLFCAISLYESFAVVYVLAVFSIMLIKVLFSNDNPSFKECFLEGIKYAILLLIVIIFNYVITKAILLIFNIKPSTHADKSTTYSKLGIKGGIVYLINTIIMNFIIDGLSYLPITYLVISSLISIIIGLVYSVKKKDVLTFWIVLGMNFSLLLMSFILGKASFYRTDQQFQLFVPIIFMILTQIILSLNLKKVMKNVFIFVIFLMVFYQVKDIYKWQYINYLKYEKEKNDAILMGNELQSKYDVENKPIILIASNNVSPSLRKYYTVKENSLHKKVLDFYNTYFLKGALGENIGEYKFVETSIMPYFEWATIAFYDEEIVGIEVVKFFKYLGYDFKPGTQEMFMDGLYTINSQDIPVWPKEGSIIEKDNYILINMFNK